MRAFLLAVLACLLPVFAYAQEAYPKGKLPTGVTPLSYKIDLTVLPDQETFSGHTEIEISLTTDSTRIFLHGRDFENLTVTALSGSVTQTAQATQVDDLGVLRLDFKTPLKAGQARLIFDYTGAFTETAAGLYRVKVGTDWYVWSQFESIDARHAFPSFDEPGFKTPFTVSLTTRPGHMAVSNNPEISTEKSGELIKHNFATTVPLPTYLVAFVVGPFISVEGVAPPTKYRPTPLPLRIIATKPNAGKLDYALRETPRIVELLEDYFGMAFPFPKLDQIASPIMPGAMENAGADIYGDNILLLDDKAPKQSKQLFGMVVSHELSHQWFGDYATPAWWDDLWLNESFANWMGYRIGNIWRPELDIGVGAIEDGLNAMDTDALKAGRPIRQPITDSARIDEAFDQITYGKGGHVVAMIAAYMGDDAFREGVRLHMKRHPYGSATTEDFFGSLADAAHDPRVLASLKSFIDQQGVPQVSLSRDTNGWRISQSRYTRLGSDTAPAQWIIPVCVRQIALRTCTLLDRPQSKIEASVSALPFPNAGGLGYYRFALSEADWKSLLKGAAALPPGEAHAAIDSLWAQFAAGQLKSELLLEAVVAFAAHPDPDVAMAAALALSEYKHRGLIGPESYESHSRLIGRIYLPRLAEMGLDLKAHTYDSETLDRRVQRQKLVGFASFDARDTATRQALLSATQALLRGNPSALSPEFVFFGLRVYAESSPEDEVYILFERLLVTQNDFYRMGFLYALGYSGRPEIAKWLLERMEGPLLRSSDRAMLLQALMDSPTTRDLAFEYFRKQLPVWNRSAGVFYTRQMASIADSYCSVARANELDALVRPMFAEAGGNLPYERMIEDVRLCGVLKDAKSADLAKALSGVP